MLRTLLHNLLCLSLGLLRGELHYKSKRAVSLTSSSVWIPAEFWAACMSVSLAHRGLEYTVYTISEAGSE